MTAITNIGKKGIGHTQTFISIGAFDTLNEAKNLQKYFNVQIYESTAIYFKSYSR